MIILREKLAEALQKNRGQQVDGKSKRGQGSGRLKLLLDTWMSLKNRLESILTDD